MWKTLCLFGDVGLRIDYTDREQTNRSPGREDASHIFTRSISIRFSISRVSHVWNILHLVRCALAHVAIFAHGTRSATAVQNCSNFGGDLCTPHLWPNFSRSINFSFSFDSFPLSRSALNNGAAGEDRKSIWCQDFKWTKLDLLAVVFHSNDRDRKGHVDIYVKSDNRWRWLKIRAIQTQVGMVLVWKSVRLTAVVLSESKILFQKGSRHVGTRRKIKQY